MCQRVSQAARGPRDPNKRPHAGSDPGRYTRADRVQRDGRMESTVTSDGEAVVHTVVITCPRHDRRDSHFRLCQIDRYRSPGGWIPVSNICNVEYSMVISCTGITLPLGLFNGGLLTCESQLAANINLRPHGGLIGKLRKSGRLAQRPPRDGDNAAVWKVANVAAESTLRPSVVELL